MELKRLLRDSVSSADAMTKRVSQLEAQLVEALAAGQARDDVTAAQKASEDAQAAAASARAEAEAHIAQARWGGCTAETGHLCWCW